MRPGTQQSNAVPIAFRVLSSIEVANRLIVRFWHPIVSRRPSFAGLKVGNDRLYQRVCVWVSGGLGERGAAGKRFLQ
jgi:hypothetical protein